MALPLWALARGVGVMVYVSVQGILFLRSAHNPYRLTSSHQSPLHKLGSLLIRTPGAAHSLSKSYVRPLPTL
jgi:hypothetical protein